MSQFQGKAYAVAGLGIAGLAAARLLAARGAHVVAWDEKARQAMADDALSELEALGADCLWSGALPDGALDGIVASPGVPMSAPLLRWAAERNIEILGELELAYRCTQAPFIAITGTNGKTTTTTLLGAMFERAGASHLVAGNIGYPVCDAVLAAQGTELLIVEVSSFQLETVSRFRPRVSVLLNIAPDHLDRHGSLEAYAGAKYRILKNQTPEDVFLYNACDPLCAKAPATNPAVRSVPFATKPLSVGGAFLRGSRLILADPAGFTMDLGSVHKLGLTGLHNVSNALAAAAAAATVGVPLSAIRNVLQTFRGLEHRLETVGVVEGVTYIDDSKATNPEAAKSALLSTGMPVVLIAGGFDEQADFGTWAEMFPQYAKHVVLFGQTAGRIERSALAAGMPAERIHRCDDMEQCIRAAAQLADPGEAVLLSPACASYGLYRNFEERGNHFKELVRALEGKEGEEQSE